MKRYNKGYGEFPNFNKTNMGGRKMFSCKLFILIDGNEKKFLLKTEISLFMPIALKLLP